MTTLFLITIKANRLKWAEAAILTSYDEAVEAATKHVGEHNPIDGCSTPVVKWHSGDLEKATGVRYRVSRNTSFGERIAVVTALTLNGNFEDYN